MGFLQLAAVFLLAAVVAVPVAKRLGLGAIVGYLAAGVVLGPSVLGLVDDPQSILTVAEFGVALLLFVIGLELAPARLRTMRQAVFVAGSLQVVLTGLAGGALAWVLGLSLPVAMVVGFGLALSSTPLGLQLLAENRTIGTPHGRMAFGILLFQDLAAVLLLVIVPILAAVGAVLDPAAVVEGVAVAFGTIFAVILLGRPGLRFVLRQMARVHQTEMFTAMALLVIVALALLFNQVGLSAALGAFMAGVLLAGSEYRHQLETDIAPFRDLLLGLFFMTVAMTVDWPLVLGSPGPVLALTAAMLAGKALILIAVALMLRQSPRDAFGLAASIGQGGEYAFVIFGTAAGLGLVAGALADLLIAAVAVSMALTPLLYKIFLMIADGRGGKASARAYDTDMPDAPRIIIAGFGRVGQITGRLLAARKVPFTALDIDPDHVDFVQRFGNRVYFGDAARLDLLRTAGAEHAQVLLIAVDDVEASLRIAEAARANFPQLRVLARARNRQHLYKLWDLGVHDVTRETFAGALELATDALHALGVPIGEARDAAQLFRTHDQRILREIYGHHRDEKSWVHASLAGRKQLEELFEADRANREREGPG